jgi:hypothetical protein
MGDDDGFRQLEREVAAESSKRFQQAIDAVQPEHLGCGDPDKVTDALARELKPRGIHVATDRQRGWVRDKFGEPIARGEPVRTVRPTGANPESAPPRTT